MIFLATVRDVTSDGRGVISTPEGQTCFVGGVWPGEEGRFRITPGKGRVATAELIEITTPSDKRRDAACRFHGHGPRHCGGCPWQFIEYEAQLGAKQKRVVNALEKLSENINVLPIIASPHEFSYRNRAQFKTDGEGLGFEAGFSNTLVSINACPVLTEKNQETLQALLTTLPNKHWKPKKRRQAKARSGRSKQTRTWTTLDIDETRTAESVSVNKRLPFQQGNSEQNRAMQAWLGKQLVNSQTQNALELFCGSGNFTSLISQAAKNKVIAAEADKQAIQKLAMKNLSGVVAICEDIYSAAGLNRLLFRAANTDTLVLDPPRDGLKALNDVCRSLTGLKNIFYISCDLASFSRDAANIMEAGFELLVVQPIDLFPQTPHVELMATFSKA